ncbi:MAG: DedA family protein [Dactylosporangium sp.]|nr:DedA family protein [Dactylosporangium sp.]
MGAVLDWLAGLPPAALYIALGVFAFVENIFPPFPADTVVAFGSFLAARGESTMLGAFLATWIGNVAGAMAVYGISRRYGAGALQQRLLRHGGEPAQHRVEQLYRKHGVLALFLSRFLPGARALVPPFAGALRMPAATALITIGLASGLWYGIVTIAAYRVGANWSAIEHLVRSLSRDTAIVAAIVLLLGGAAWLIHRRRRQQP